jgi:hypothetical protein
MLLGRDVMRDVQMQGTQKLVNRETEIVNRNE